MKTDWREHLDDPAYFICVHISAPTECGRYPYADDEPDARRRHSYPIKRQERIAEILDRLGEDIGFICPECEVPQDSDPHDDEGFCPHTSMDLVIEGIKKKQDHRLIDRRSSDGLAYWVWEYDIRRATPTWWLRATRWKSDIPLTTREAEAVCLGMWLVEAVCGTDHLYRAIALGETLT